MEKEEPENWSFTKNVPAALFIMESKVYTLHPGDGGQPCLFTIINHLLRSVTYELKMKRKYVFY